ncbi:hypothetical protein HT031_001064 [Scenedesmus sp. PABB004]|nr:hypothetical protein HT031_001064 [Scenedesmus sp. PABB004]
MALPPRAALLAALLALAAATAAGSATGDRTINTVSANCKDQFDKARARQQQPAAARWRRWPAPARTHTPRSAPAGRRRAQLMKTNYGGDSDCGDKIKDALSSAPAKAGDYSDCPGGAEAGPGSAVQKCMSQPGARDAWLSFIKGCEVLNVNERTGAGEAEAAADAKPSCFPRFNSLTAFTNYLDGKAATATSGAGQRAGAAAAAVAAAVAAAALLL